MLKKEYLYGFDDVSIEPYYMSEIESRKDIEDINHLLYTAPMDTVIGDMASLDKFYEAGVNTIMVRGFWKTHLIDEIKYPHRVSLTLDEFEDFVNGKSGPLMTYLDAYKDKFWEYIILVDVANGHMKRLYTLSEKCKDKYGPLVDLMVGNIANPMTYQMYAKIEVDSIRLSIGTGSACLTSSKTAIHYPAISLIDECKRIKNTMGLKTKIIMDGGIRDSSDIIKAFAAGADGVMMGSMFNKCVESSGQKLFENTRQKINNEKAEKHYKTSGVLVKYRGMSTNEVQQKERGDHKNYEEGLVRFNTVKYTIDELMYELNYSIKSAFSYCYAKDLALFYRNAVLHLVTPSRKHNTL